LYIVVREFVNVKSYIFAKYTIYTVVKVSFAPELRKVIDYKLKSVALNFKV